MSFSAGYVDILHRGHSLSLYCGMHFNFVCLQIWSRFIVEKYSFVTILQFFIHLLGHKSVMFSSY